MDHVTINEPTLKLACDALAEADRDLEKLLLLNGLPDVWRRAPGFATLVLIILEQQVSLASARAAFERLLEALDELTPAQFLALDDKVLRDVGFSRQKTIYVRALAQSLELGSLSLDDLVLKIDQDARTHLMHVKGIGAWTADIYLMMALGRPDIWPAGDLALAKAVQSVKQLSEMPSRETQAKIAEAWKPWRSVAARILWHHYLIHIRPASVRNLE